MDWLRLRKRAVEATLITEYPTDARRAHDDPRGAELDPEIERGLKLRRRAMVFILYTVFIAGSVMALFGKDGMLDLLRLHRDLREVRAAVAEQQQRVGQIEATVDALRGDPAARERVAREKLGLIHDGEVVFLLPHSEPEGEGLGDAEKPAAEEAPPGE